MCRSLIPPIGTEMWTVMENFWKKEGYYGSIREFIVVPGKVRKIDGQFFSLLRRVPGPKGDPNQLNSKDVPWYKQKDIGVHVFFSAKEAARAAQALTEKEERLWGAVMQPPHYPLRRTWAPYLEVVPG